jgi:hypothetical protein
MLAEITIGDYPKEAEKLVEIWNNHLELIGEGLDIITFKNKRPKRPKNDNRRIAGLSAKSITYLKDDEELIKMSVENFICLMAKCGVDIQIKEKV